MKKCSFPPSVTPECSVLVLGSLPGDESLRQAQYYAHPRNAFWKIMGTLLDFDPSLPYGERLSLLNLGGVGLWDVVASGVRPGSLDQHISQEQPNDIAALLECFPGIGTVSATAPPPINTSSGIFRNYSSGKPLPSSRCPPPARRRRG